MKGYVVALRLPVCIMGSSLVLVGARLSQVPLQAVWLKAVFVLVTMSATMAWNDWRDRWHDIRKDKVFVVENERSFRVFVSVLWVLAFSLVAAVLVSDTGCWAAVLLVVIGCVYSELRLVPLVPNLIVAIGSALPVLLVPATFESMMIFGAVFAVIFAREIIKDFEDVAADQGYKWTLPLTFGSGWGTAISATGLVVAAVFLRLASDGLAAGMMQAALVTVACWIVVAVFRKGSEATLSRLKLVLDVGMALYLASVIITGAP